MSVLWQLGQNQTNPGEQFQQGYRNALAMREHSQDRALQMQQMQAQQAQQKQQQAFQLTDRHRQDIRLGAGIARQYEQRTGRPMDEAGWQVVRQAAQAAGVDLAGVPERFDPSYYQQLIAAGQAIDLQAQRQQAPTTLQRNDEYIRANYGEDAGDQYVSRQVAPPPITQHNADGTITIIPQAGAPIHRRDARPQAQSQQPVTMTPEQLTAQAEEAIRNGADPDAVHARLRQMLGGGGNTSPPAGGPAPAFSPGVPLTVEDRRSQYPSHAPGRGGSQGPRTFR